MANNKFYTVTKEINGKQYKAQFNGISHMLKILDDTYISDSSSNHSNVKMAEMLFDSVIVEPKGLTPDSFDDTDEYNKVFNFAVEVAKGKFRDKQDIGKEKSEN